MPRTVQTEISVSQKLRRGPCIRIILTLALLLPALSGQEPPKDLARRVALREMETEQARGNYTYRQTVLLQELDRRGARMGEYQEVRDIIFLPGEERTEQFIGRPVRSLKRLILTEEDFRDIREVQPFLFTPDQLWMYETRFRGEETMDDVACYVLQVRPRQILDGQRLFDGLFWVSKKDFSIVRCEGQAVPQIRRSKSENLFPRFTTLRQQVDGKHWFPVFTYADDILDFRGGPQRVRLTIRYSNYKCFSAESVVTYELEK
jgi:hypothetical protein